MATEPGKPDAPLLDAHSRIVCFHCGYSLAQLSPSQVCPECGTPIDETLSRVLSLLPNDSPIVCHKCREPLAGRSITGECPTCAVPVHSSVFAFRQAEMRAKPLSLAERSVIVLYGAVLAILLALGATWSWLGSGWTRGSRFLLGAAATLLLLGAIILGLALCLYMMDRRPRLAIWIGASLMAIVAGLLVLGL